MGIKLTKKRLLDYFYDNTRADLKNYDRYELLDGTKLTSPNQILKPLNSEKYKDIPQFVLNAAKENGLFIHQALQNIFSNKKQPKNLPPKWVKVADEAKNIFEENNFKVVASELPILSEENNYYGFIDYLISKKDNPIILELKTRSKLKSEDNWLSERLQLYLYQLALKELGGNEVCGYLLVINRNKPKEYELIKNELTETELDLLNVLIKLDKLKKELQND